MLERSNIPKFLFHRTGKDRLHQIFISGGLKCLNMKCSCFKFEDLRYKNGIDVWKCIFLADSAEITALNTWHRKDDAVVMRIKSENLDYSKLDWDFNITNPRNTLYHHNFVYFDDIPAKFLEIC